MVSSFTWNSIAEIIELGKQTTRNHLKKLENKGIVQAVSKKLLKFKLTQEAEQALESKIFPGNESIKYKGFVTFKTENY